MKTIIEAVSQHAFLKDLPQELLPLLATCAKLEKFRAHEQIFKKDYDAGAFYLITSGEIALETPYIPGEGVITLLTLRADEALGWSWLFPPYQWHFSSRAAEATEAIVFNAARLRELCEEFPLLGYQIAIRVGGILLQRLQSTQVRLLDLCDLPH